MTTIEWTYSGDVNLEYGGAYFDLSTWRDGYVSVVRITDLDSGCGFRGACMIEHGTIYGTMEKDRIRKAIGCCGWDVKGRAAIAEALMSYGYVDYDDCRTEIVQLEPDGPMRFDGWRAEKRLHNTDLRAYVESQHLDD